MYITTKLAKIFENNINSPTNIYSNRVINAVETQVIKTAWRRRVGYDTLPPRYNASLR